MLSISFFPIIFFIFIIDMNAKSLFLGSLVEYVRILAFLDHCIILLLRDLLLVVVKIINKLSKVFKKVMSSIFFLISFKWYFFLYSRISLLNSSLIIIILHL